MRAKMSWLMNLVVVVLLTAAPASVQSSTSSELATQVRNALNTACTVVDYATTIAQQFHSLGKALENLGNAGTLTPNQLGKAGEDRIGDLLDQGRFTYSEQVPFSDVQSRRTRRGDFFIQKDRARVYIEVKNKNRITPEDVAQIRDYGRGGGHTIVAVRPGAKISRTAARTLFSRWRAGLITVVECVF
jgi:hypothetical protein